MCWRVFVGVGNPAAIAVLTSAGVTRAQLLGTQLRDMDLSILPARLTTSPPPLTPHPVVVFYIGLLQCLVLGWPTKWSIPIPCVINWFIPND